MSTLLDDVHPTPKAISSGNCNALKAGPPPLNYSLTDRKRSIVISWSVIAFNSCLLPIILFYALWFTRLDHDTAIQIVSPIFGLSSFFQFVKRMYYLIRKDSTCRPIGSRRFSLDFFQINFFIGVIVITALIVPSVTLDPPLVSLFAMATSVLLFMIGSELVLAFLLYHVRVKIPFRVSSIPKGSIARPGVYTIVEDIIAVDGGGGQRYRNELNVRYEASPIFRRMMNRMDGFWGVGALTTAACVTIILWTVPHVMGYWVGWSIPFLWAASWSFFTIKYVRSCLADEKASWAMGVETTWLGVHPSS